MDNTAITGHAFPFIEVSGTAYDMGYQHGKQAADLVHKYLLWIDKLTGKPRDELCQNARAFHPLIEKLSPLLMEEIRGLADGAGISFDEALLCQARARPPVFRPRGVRRSRLLALRLPMGIHWPVKIRISRSNTRCRHSFACLSF